jgi:hypothetical protein
LHSDDEDEDAAAVAGHVAADDDGDEVTGTASEPVDAAAISMRSLCAIVVDIRSRARLKRRIFYVLDD